MQVTFSAIPLLLSQCSVGRVDFKQISIYNCTASLLIVTKVCYGYMITGWNSVALSHAGSLTRLI